MEVITEKKPRISVGLPLYNCEKYVGAAIEAHLAQTYEDFELIITDNASTDRSAEICRAYAAKDPRVKYHSNPRNLGATGNFRRCFELATGEYFRWQPSDDLVSPNLLAKAVELLDHDRSIMTAYGRTKLIDAGGNFVCDFDENLHLMDNRPSRRWRDVQRNIRLGNLHYGLTRTASLRKTGLLRNYNGGDIPLIAEMALYGKFYEIPDAFFYRRVHEQAASSASKNEKAWAAFFDPSKPREFFPRTWAHLGANWWSVARSPIDLSEKLRVNLYMARQALWERRSLTMEVAGMIRHSLQG